MATQIGRKLFYDISTGNILVDTGERSGSVIATTIDQDITTFTALSERNRPTFDYIELPFGAYAQDFAECNGYRVNVETKAIEFSYPDPNQPIPEPVYQTPLSTQVKELESQLMTDDDKYKALDLTIADLQTVKDAKMKQLEEACDNAIVSGFDSTINGISYRFSCSLSAQSNFQGTDTLFKDGLITEAEWTVENNQTKLTERITINQTTFNSLKLQVFQHINTNISKLRNTLQPQVESALLNTDVDEIKW